MKMIRPTEAQLQIGVCQWLDRGNWIGEYFSVPNEGAYKNKRLQKMGVKKGVGDLVFHDMPDCRFAFVELKRKGGNLTDAQADFQIKSILRGTPYEVIISDDINYFVDCLTGLLRGWGAMK